MATDRMFGGDTAALHETQKAKWFTLRPHNDRGDRMDVRSRSSATQTLSRGSVDSVDVKHVSDFKSTF